MLRKYLIVLSLAVALVGAPFNAYAAIGDAQGGCVDVALSTASDIKPTGADVWLVQNLHLSASFKLTVQTATVVAILETWPLGVWELTPGLIVTATRWLTLDNEDAGADHEFCWAGVQIG